MSADPHDVYRRDAHFAGSVPSAAKPYGGASTTGGAEHSNVVLLTGEQSLFAGDFTPSPIFRHIKTGLVVTGDRVIARYPQYMFFFVKVGHAESSIPISQVCEVTTGRLLSHRRVRAALLCGFIAFFLLMTSMSLGPLGFIGVLLALVLMAFAAFQAWLARGLALTVSHSGGGSVRVDVDKLELNDMQEAGRVIHQLVLGSGGEPRPLPSGARAAIPETAPGGPASSASPREQHTTPLVSPSPAPAAAQAAAPPTLARPATPPPSPKPVQPPTEPPPPSAPPSIWRG